MCGRFHFNGNDKDIQKILDDLPESEKNVQIKFGDIYPTYYLPIITQEKHPILSKWGFGKGAIWNHVLFKVSKMSGGVSAFQMLIL